MKNWKSRTIVVLSLGLVGAWCVGTYADPIPPAKDGDKPAKAPAPSERAPKKARPATPAPTEPKHVGPDIAQPPDFDSGISVTKIIEQACKNLGRRYNLTKAQQEQTERLMKGEVNKFLTEHHDQVWPLIRDLLSWQMKPDSATNPDDIRRVGKGAGSLMAAIEKAIHDGNEAWRQILTPEQMALHDFDLREMDKQFKQFEDNFSHMEKEGKFKDDNGIFPPPDPKALASQPPTPPKPPEGIPRPAHAVFDIDLFDRWTAEFIKEYELDEGQTDAAKSILNEFRADALAYLATKKEVLTDLEQQRQAALSANDLRKIRAINEQQRDLYKPVQEMLPAMDKRLHALLTTTQIERHDAMKAAQAAAKKSAAPSNDNSSKPAANPQKPSEDRKDAPKEQKPKPAEPAAKDTPAPTQPPAPAAPSKPAEANPPKPAEKSGASKPAEKPSPSKPGDSPAPNKPAEPGSSGSNGKP